MPRLIPKPRSIINENANNIENIEDELTMVEDLLIAHVEKQQIEIAFNYSYDHQYRELSYENNTLTKVETWNTDAKHTKLFTRTLSYDLNDNLIQTITTDEITGTILVIDFVYDLNDNLINTTKNFLY